MQRVASNVPKQIASGLTPRTSGELRTAITNIAGGRRRQCWVRFKCDTARALEPVSGSSPWVPGPRTGLNRANKVRAARPRVAGSMAGAKAGREGQPTRKVRGAIQLPTPDEQISRLAHVSGVLLSMAEGQLIDLSEDEHVVAIVAVCTVVDTLIKARRSPIVVCSGMLKSVVPVKGQPGRKTLLHGHLQRVVFVIEVVPEVTEALRPAILGVKRSALIPRQVSDRASEIGIVARQLRVVERIVWATADSVRPFIANIGNGRADCLCVLPLYGSVPGIHTRPPVCERT